MFNLYLFEMELEEIGAREGERCQITRKGPEVSGEILGTVAERTVKNGSGGKL